MNFIDGLLEYTKDFESPKSFWKWSAYSVIASILRDNVYIQDGDSKLYPNLYILFLAGSGARKNRPVNMAEEFVRAVDNTKVIAGRASIQGILDELSRTETHAKTGKLGKSGAATFFAPELGAGIVESPEAIKILTDIYDGKTNFAGILRHTAKTNAERIVFNAFMATNEEMSKGVFDNVAIYGGLLARTLLIVPDEFRKSNSLLRKNDALELQRKEYREELILHLRAIGKLNGRILFSEGAIDAHEKWYEPFRDRYLQKGDKSGIYGRLHTHIKKLSLVIAADSLCDEVQREHMEQATTECTQLLNNYNMFIMSAGKSTLAEVSALILKDMLVGTEKAGNRQLFSLSKKEILWRYHTEFDSETLDKTMQTLEGAGIVESMATSQGMEWRLSKKAINTMGKKSNETAT